MASTEHAQEQTPEPGDGDRAGARRPRLRRGARFVLGLALLIVLVDLLIAAGGVDQPEAVEGPGELRAMLAELAEGAKEHEGSSWLLIGDSVLVGDTGAAELPQWREHQLIDDLERELAVDEAVEFRQLAYSGLLPVDMQAFVEELDAADPEGEVSLLLELSPRYFSRAYAEQREHTRPWIAELGDADSAAAFAGLALDWIGRHMPVYRHRPRFAALRRELAEPAASAEAPVDDEASARAGLEDRVEGLARLRVHYREPALDADSVQVAALLDILARCRARGRRVVLFATPVEDEFLSEQQSEREQGRYLARLDRLIAPDGEQVDFLPMDHPLFASELFWDHVHLRPEGHRLLALNLLHQIGLGLARTPELTELIASERVEASLVARLTQGFCDGPAWQAKFAEPEGLALSADGRRLIVADRNNHVLRELSGDFRVVSTVAGEPGEAGEADGPAREARLDHPSDPLILDGAVYFSDHDGRSLRRLADGRVRTLPRAEPGWRIRATATDGAHVVVLEAQGTRTRVAVYAPEGGQARVLVNAGNSRSRKLVALTFDPEGTLYLATADGRIHRLAKAATRERPASIGSPELELLFANAGAEILPQEEHASFPLPFEDVRLSTITDLVWVERYGGLLVQDLVAQRKPGRFEKSMTERVQLRYLDPERELVYPWLKPLVAGIGYFYKNKDTDTYGSYYHRGSMALEQGSATLFYLERDRSRLIRIDDGLLGVAKIGHVHYSRLGFHDVLTTKAGPRTFKDQRPQRFLAEQNPYEPLERRYTCLLVASSLQSMSDLVGQYSIGRMIEAQLGRELAARDRVDLELFHVTEQGGRFSRQLSAISTFIKEGGRPDLIFIEANASVFLSEEDDDAAMLDKLDKLERQVHKWDSKLVILDVGPYVARNREGLRPSPAYVDRFLELARIRGITVIDVADAMVEAALDVSPISSPPYGGIHLSTWAMDALAQEFVAALAPVVREALRDRTPAVELERGPAKIRRRPKRLDMAFELAEADWPAILPKVPLAVMQTRYQDDHLEVFVDLGRLPEGVEYAEDELDGVILACVYEQVVRRSNGARSADVKIGRFSHYDEYGAGVGEGATVLRHDELKRRALEKLIARYLKARE